MVPLLHCRAASAHAYVTAGAAQLQPPPAVREGRPPWCRNDALGQEGMLLRGWRADARAPCRLRRRRWLPCRRSWLTCGRTSR
jgi:hypothetical protein